MDSNYPGNSRSAAKPHAEEVTGEKKEKVGSVITNGATRRKKPLTKRLTETFVGGDIKSVTEYVIMSVLVPAAKDMISDAFSQGVERMLFGDSSRGSRRSSRPSGTSGYVSYNRMGPSQSRGGGLNEFARRPERRSSYDFDDIILATRAEADEVIERMFDLINQYEQVTVADLLELVDISSNHVDHKWGWNNLTGASVAKTRDGYLLDLPRPESLAS